MAAIDTARGEAEEQASGEVGRRSGPVACSAAGDKLQGD